ncbi:hypothetical protein [uncultured Methylobacterium sp.]|uniref:hypothetical protein n=1 Tax=uncultured Methylobacterium sp. TaxID=157278 RepID=UPI0035CC1B58
MRTAKTLRWLLVGGLVLLGGWFGVLVARGEEPGGIEEAWMLLGPPDLGPVDVATLARTRGDALACPPDHCRVRADIVAPTLPVSGERLRAIVAAVAAGEPRTERVFEDRWAEEDRYVARSKVLRLPDTIAVAIVGAGQGRATLALYARPQFALTDLGGNRARLVRWLARIEALARDEAGR